MTTPSGNFVPLMANDGTGENRLGGKLGDLRKVRGLALRDAARQLGISHARLREFEAGKDHRTGKPVVPTRPLLEKMAALYGFPAVPLMLLGGYPAEEPPAVVAPTDAELDAREIAEICMTLPTGRRKLLIDMARSIRAAKDLS